MLDYLKNAANKVAERLKAAKADWAALAQKDPDAARRELRSTYLWIAANVGIVSCFVGFLLAQALG